MGQQNSKDNSMSRRDVLKTTTLAAGTVAASQLVLPKAYAAENDTVQIALVGCGGRGTGAASNALSSPSAQTKLVAMADVIEEKLDRSYYQLATRHQEKVEVPEDQQFVGFDGYKKAMDMLNPGDVVILTTPPAFRWLHFTYAIEKGLNVFMEKPVTVDGPGSRKMFELADKADEKNLKVGVGLMCRHCAVRQELHDRIQDGEIGDILLMRAYRMAGPTASAFTLPRNPEKEPSELLYQIKNFHSFLWLSGGAYSDFLIHNIDECCWMKEAFPVEAKASGGRHYRGDYIDQNFDTYSVEYTFADGTKLDLQGRTMVGAHKEFASYAHGTKGSAVISTAAHTPAKCRIYSDQSFSKEKLVWEGPKQEPNPYQLEWDHLLTAILNDTPYNEVRRGVEASLVTSMGRMAAHTGRVVTRDEILNSDHEFAPNLAELTMESDAPLKADEEGLYPVPAPGLQTRREY